MRASASLSPTLPSPHSPPSLSLPPPPPHSLAHSLTLSPLSLLSLLSPLSLLSLFLSLPLALPLSPSHLRSRSLRTSVPSHVILACCSYNMIMTNKKINIKMIYNNINIKNIIMDAPVLLTELASVKKQQ
jgi:hypothetical protein